MEEIDLSDRKGLIAMAYGPGTENFKSASTATLASTKTNDKAPLKQNQQNAEKEKKKPSRVGCALSTCLLLFFIALAACALSALVAYWITKQHYDRTGDVQPFVPDPRYNISQLQSEEDFEDDVGEGPTAEELRLPKDLEPLWYNLTVQTYVPGYVDIPKEKNLTYAASVTIKFKVLTSTDKIVLSSYELKFPDEATKYKIMTDRQSVMRFRRELNETEVEMSNNGTELVTDMMGNNTVLSNESTMETTTQLAEENTERSNVIPKAPIGLMDSGIRIVDVKVNDTLEQVVFKLSGNLPAGQEFYFKLPFTGNIRESLNGLYQSNYKTKNGSERVIVVTHFEPTYARRFVPCFDEPHLKAVWKVKAIHPKGSQATSNSLEEKQSVPIKGNEDWVSTTFEETLPISTYLFALAITDFEFTEGKTKSGTRFRVWARPEARNQTQYALEAGVKVLQYYEDFYGIPFPMPKQDMMALPDFEQGAMENMGLITYRETSVLYDPKLYKLDDKKNVALTVAHELAHQWFGDLVTMKWWDDLWLNEGFATFVEFMGTDAISNKDFRMMDSFQADSQWRAFIRDARSSSHPLSFKITKAFEVEDAFDSISYDKGASILVMLQTILGHENFKKGIEIYLNRHKYKNAEAADLWKALDEAAPKELKTWEGKQFNVPDFAEKWTKQMGYPVVEVYRIDQNTVELTQKRFKTDALTPEKAKYRNAPFWYKWDVPLWMSIDGETQPMQWLHEAYRMNLTENQLLLVNPDSVGFYRINYNQRGWEAIQRQLNEDHTKIPTHSRARLIDDAFALAEANQLPYEVAFNMTSYLSKETELVPWLSALRGLFYVQQMFGDEPDSEGIRDFVQSRLSPLFNKLDLTKINFDKDSQLFESILTDKAVSEYCGLRASNCTQKLGELFKTGLLDACKEGEVASECSTIPVTIRETVYCEGVLSNTEAVFDKMKELYEKEPVAIEKRRLLEALGCSRDTYTLKKLFKSALNKNDTSIRSQDIYVIIDQIGSNPVGSKVTFDFIQDNWKDIHKGYSDSTNVIRDVVQFGIQPRTERKLRELEHFLDTHKSSTRNHESFRRVLERGKTDVNWMKNHRQRLTDYFKAQNEQKTEL